MSQPLSQSSSQGFNLSQNTFNRVWDTNDIPSCIGMCPSTIMVQEDNRVEFTVSTTLSQAASQAPVAPSFSPVLTEEYLLDPILGIPSDRPFPGVHNFQIKFPKEIEGESKSIPWTYSSVLNKFFVKKLTMFPVCFTTNQGLRTGGAKLRLMPTFKKIDYVREPITRCPNHMQQNEDGHPNPLHVFKTNHSDAEYVMEANRPCILLPFQPSVTTGEATYFFASACFSSCLPGGRIIGRDTVDVRVCASPGRDKITHVRNFLKQASASNGDDVARQASKIRREPPPDSDSEPGISHQEGKPVQRKIRQRCTAFLKSWKDPEAKRECVEEDSDSETVYYVAVKGKKHYGTLLEVYENLKLFDRLVKENSKIAERDRKETREMQPANGLAALQPANGLAALQPANGLAALQPANGQDLSQQELSGSSVGSSNGSQSQSRSFHYSLKRVVSFQ
ncbi:cellular tumor antigen p53-like [Oscarella lobularis]|uniref:cellular tumor antigen p53-like n=1 Tax=Oscarella lobularis TaxID=121494 RepID=UPI0033135961